MQADMIKHFLHRVYIFRSTWQEIQLSCIKKIKRLENTDAPHMGSIGVLSFLLIEQAAKSIFRLKLLSNLDRKET